MSSFTPIPARLSDPLRIYLPNWLALAKACGDKGSHGLPHVAYMQTAHAHPGAESWPSGIIPELAKMPKAAQAGSSWLHKDP